MQNMMPFIDKMNIYLWILGISAAHALMYILLGTDTWLATTLLATSVYAAGLLVLKLVAKRYVDNRQKDTF